MGVNLRQFAAGQSCVACGAKDHTVVLAHYFGPRRHSYGGGMSKKGHDAVAAHLCARCHLDMDTNTRSKAKRWEASEIFLHYCALTWLRVYAELTKGRACH
jgi:hypothetical protein